MPPPRILHLVSSREIAGFLPQQLQPIPGAAGSRGAHVQADPALALTDPEERARQVARWLCQIAADAGLSGMEEPAPVQLTGNDASHARTPDPCGHGLCCVQAVPLSPPRESNQRRPGR